MGGHAFCAYLPRDLARHIVRPSDMVNEPSPLERWLLPRRSPYYACLQHHQVCLQHNAQEKATITHLPHRIFYWFGARYNAALFIQAAITIFVQCALLHVALLYRPLVGMHPSFNNPHVGFEVDIPSTRPWNFWRWRSRRLYWHFLAYFIIVLTVLQIIFGPEDTYSSVQGYVALSVEAILPLPQIWQNSRRRSCRGFKFSVLVNWIAGDVFKMTYYFLLEGGVPWAFKLCGLFRVCCDFYLGFQYWMYAGYSPDTHR